MNKILTLFVLLFFLLPQSCLFEKSYKYIAIEKNGNDLSFSETGKKTIYARSDSAAYLEAYQWFIINQQLNQKIRDRIGNSYPELVTFQLIRKDIDIVSTIIFNDKEKLEKEIENRVKMR